jgi:hypothetical protein
VLKRILIWEGGSIFIFIYTGYKNSKILLQTNMILLRVYNFLATGAGSRAELHRGRPNQTRNSMSLLRLWFCCSAVRAVKHRASVLSDLSYSQPHLPSSWINRTGRDAVAMAQNLQSNNNRSKKYIHSNLILEFVYETSDWRTDITSERMIGRQIAKKNSKYTRRHDQTDKKRAWRMAPVNHHRTHQAIRAKP